MYTSNIAQYLNIDNENVSPLVNIESLYYERASVSTNGYEINRQSMFTHMPIMSIVEQPTTYVKATSQFTYNASFETNNASYTFSIIGQTSKEYSDISLNSGYAKAMDVSTFYVDTSGNFSLNRCLVSYETKGDYKKVFNNLCTIADNSIGVVVSQLNSSLNDAMASMEPFDVSIIMNAKNINNASTQTAKVANIIYNYGLPIIESSVYVSGKEDSSYFMNMYIHTHESLWRLVATNSLIPGNTYKMLYYPKYDTSLVETAYISRSISNGCVNANITNMAALTQPIQTNKATYNEFPRIMKLTAINKSQFSKYVKFEDYYNAVSKYVNNFSMLSKTANLISIKKNATMEYVILDIVKVEKGKQGLIAAYNHDYGYMFILDDYVEAFLANSTLSNTKCIAFNKLYRYFLGPQFPQPTQLMVNDLLQRYIFKKSINGNTWSDSSINNITMTLLEYNDLQAKFGNAPTQLYITLQPSMLQASNKEIYFGSSKYDYADIIDKIEYDKWEGQYDFDTNSISYLKDEFGNEADFDFRSKKINYFGLESDGYVFNNSSHYMSNGNYVVSFERDGQCFDYLLYQSVVSSRVLAYNNVIKNSSNCGFIKHYSNASILANNSIINSNNTIIIDSSFQAIKDNTSIYIIDSYKDVIQHSQNIGLVNSREATLDNLIIQTNFDYSNIVSTSTCILNNADSSYCLSNCYQINLSNDNFNALNMHNDAFVDICDNSSINANVSLNHIGQVKMHANTYGIRQVVSYMEIFNGSTYFNSSAFA